MLNDLNSEHQFLICKYDHLQYTYHQIFQYIQKSPFETYVDFYNYIANTIPGKVLFKKIIDEITVGETYFFRNPPQLEMFKKYVIP